MHNLLSLPLELRRQIYKEAWAPKLNLHLFLEDGRPRVSPCLGANLGHEERTSRMLTDAERGELKDCPSVLGLGNSCQLLRRLRSLWGPHYKCEEVVNGPWLGGDLPVLEGHGCVSMLMVCQQM